MDPDCMNGSSIGIGVKCNDCFSEHCEGPFVVSARYSIFVIRPNVTKITITLRYMRKNQ